MSPYRHILDGYKVLDFTQFVAGPTVTRLLAEMGADVIKVELAPGGDPMRTMYVFKDGRSSLFVQHNRGKKSLCLDGKSAAGREILSDLARTTDVLVENFTPGAIARLGLGYDALSQINPRIIMCSISGFGQSGPLADKPGFDTLGASYAGIIDMNGYADGAPCPPGAAIGDVTAGLKRRRLDRIRPAPSRAHRQGPVPGHLSAGYLFPLSRFQRASLQRQRRRDPAQTHRSERAGICARRRLSRQAAIDRDHGNHAGPMEIARQADRAARTRR